MAKLVKNSLLESVPMLVLLGLLAGAVGGLGIGLIQLRAASSAWSTDKERLIFEENQPRTFATVAVPPSAPVQQSADRNVENRGGSQPSNPALTFRARQIANRACNTHSSPASAAPAASYKSPDRKCPRGTQSGPRGYTAPAHLSIGN